MALVLANRVQETGTANTTVSFTLAGASTGFQSFAAVGNTNTTFYAGKQVSARIQLRGRLSRARPSTLLATLEARLLSAALATFLLPTRLAGL